MTGYQTSDVVRCNKFRFHIEVSKNNKDIEVDNKQLFAVEAHKNHQLYLSSNRVMAADDGPPIQTMNMLETGNLFITQMNRYN